MEMNVLIEMMTDAYIKVKTENANMTKELTKCRQELAQLNVSLKTHVPMPGPSENISIVPDVTDMADSSSSKVTSTKSRKKSAKAVSKTRRARGVKK